MIKRIALASLLGHEALTRQQNGWTVYNDTEPFGLLYIAAIAKQEGYEVNVFHPFQKANPSEEDITRRIIEFEPDLVGFSSMTNNFLRSVRVAESVKKAYKNVKVIFGGDHVGTFPSDIKNFPIIDIGVYGEGEQTFKELLGDNVDLNSIKGISFVNGDELFVTPPRPRVMDRTQLPLAYRDAEILLNSKVGALMYPAPTKQRGAASLLFQFGCPLGCTYCSATSLYGSKLTRSSADYVVDEMAELKGRFGINTAFFTDLTFNLNARLSEDLCGKIEKSNLGISWYAFVRPTSPKNTPILQDSTLEAMVAAGCSKIGFGIESIESSAMQDYHRPTSLENDELTLRTMDRLGALSKVFLIIGHPEEKPEYYQQLVDVLKRLTPDEVRISFLTPFPGTDYWNMLQQKKVRLLTTDYNQFTTFNPVLKMKHINSDELVSYRRKILREYYGSSEFADHVQRKVAANPHFENSLREFHDLLKMQRIL